MPATGNFLGDLRDFTELHGVARAGIVLEAVPRTRPVILNFASLRGRFEKRKWLADAGQEFLFRNFGELRLRVVQVIDVHALDAEVFQTASELILQEFRRHAVATGGDIFRGEDSGLNVLAEKILVRVGRHGTVGRQVTALRAHHDFLAFEAFRGKLPDGSAEASLAALKSVVDGSVENVHAASEASALP